MQPELMRFSGPVFARLANGTPLTTVFVMLQRDPLEGNHPLESMYELWWGYLRCRSDPDDAHAQRLHRCGPVLIEPNMGTRHTPLEGWPSEPLRLEIISWNVDGSNFECLVREMLDDDDV